MTGRPTESVRGDATFAGLGSTIFETMSLLARAHGAINLGQGFPDAPGPEAIRRKAAEAVIHGWSQYAPMRGLPDLRAAVSRHYARHDGVAYDPESEVLVTSGATEALAAAIFALLSPGEEAIVIEPFYDAYGPLVRRAGGRVRPVRLAPPDWRLDGEAIEAAVTSATRLVIFNNPLNPAARAYGPEELSVLAQICARHDLIAVSDEVWERVLFDGRAHSPLSAQPQMAERTLKIGSAGKMFALTGWKVGFACGPQPLVDLVARAHQFLTFSTPPNLQSAVAFGLETHEAWFSAMRSDLQRSRDRLAAALHSGGWAVLPSEGTYFLNLSLPHSGISMLDRDFCNLCVREHGVAAIPVSAFYAADPVTSVVRLCFAKADDTLDAAAEKLNAARHLLAT